ncbi:oxidoreductase [Pullulanibacillus camelliae]|uniref:Oxidoreductase n=1 Tax=Pullulanibacillus camelliae TaxID=1707096 RepID=A0A8J2YIZ1_9BACL|nr:Gfo/Idh/MocA family oxidoreductase [Pullulanibacillus camelliae]GGE45663.1 oxidoreductase [Pullulanibacillus camelliae]
MLLDLAYHPELPKDKSKGIAIVGAGEIVRASHLPAYRLAEFHVVGIYDVDQPKARSVAEAFDLPNVFESLEELLACNDIDIVDIAIPAQYQPDVVKKAVAKGKHVLCQKPLAASFKEATDIVEACQRAGVKGAVNQQMRWSPGIRASHEIIKKGWLGELTQATIQVNVKTDFAQWPWIAVQDQIEVMYHSIHYMDAIRFLYGTPEYIYADGAKYPGQAVKGETRTMIHMKFPGEVKRGLIHDNHNNWADEDDWFATFRFEGTDGIIKGTNGALYNYPVGTSDTLSFLSKKLDESCWIKPVLEGKWFPHAFMGPMAELMRAIDNDEEPENSVSDNLLTLKMLFAAYRSMAENRPVYLDDIQ